MVSLLEPSGNADCAPRRPAHAACAAHRPSCSGSSARGGRSGLRGPCASFFPDATETSAPRRGAACRRRQYVGGPADSEGVLPNGTARKRTVQHQSGAPGWNRTSDTRFRKHVEDVTERSATCPKVPHSPRFCAGWALSGVQLSCAVVRRLVGIAAAIRRSGLPPPSEALWREVNRVPRADAQDLNGVCRSTGSHGTRQCDSRRAHPAPTSPSTARSRPCSARCRRCPWRRP